MTVVVGLIFGWWDAAELVEQALVVEPVDPFQGCEFEIVEPLPQTSIADEFGLVEIDDRLG